MDDGAPDADLLAQFEKGPIPLITWDEDTYQLEVNEEACEILSSFTENIAVLI
jgi:hypothetical protein